MLELILKILITASLAYLTVNTFFRFHFSIDRILLLIFGLAFVGCIYYLDSENAFEVILTGALIVLLYVILKLVSIKKKRHGYFFFNIYKPDYKELNDTLKDHLEACEIEQTNMNHNPCKPWLVVFKNESLKKTNDLIKKIDKLYTKKPKKITMYNYWFVIVFFILMAILWRF